MNNGNRKQEDLVAAGFHRLDQDVLLAEPPMIRWGQEYRIKWSDRRRITYLEKLASSMNHAAVLLQRERDELNRLCKLKERQLVSMNKALRQNEAMIQQEVTRMNEQRQASNDEGIYLRARIRELEAQMR